MRISEVSRRTGVSIRALRYYEQKRLLCARRLSNGYRDLDEEAVKRVQTIQMYLGLGLTTEQIEEILDCTGASPSSHPLPACEEELLALYQDKLQDIEHQMAVLTALHTRLTERVACLQRQLRTEGVSFMSTEENKTLVCRFYDEVTNGKNVALLDELLAPNFEGFTGEDSGHGQNREEFKHMISMMLKAFPDHHQTIHDWIAEHDKVVTRWTAWGTQQGEFAGIAPTGKRVKISGMDIFRVVDGKIVEVWAEVDMLGVMQQLEPHGHSEVPYTSTPQNDLESLIADLCASPPLAVVTGVAGGVMEVFGMATPLFAGDSWTVETEHWHIHSLISVVKGVRFERGPGGIAGPGTEILSIHLLDAGSSPLLSFILTDRYDAQGRPIPERFARYEELKRRYGRRDGQEVVACANGTFQR